MTEPDLNDLLTTVTEMLTENKQAATPEFLDTIDKALGTLQASPQLLAAAAQALSITPDRIESSITSVRQYLDIERKLTTGKTTESIIEVIKTIQSHSFVMQLLAMGA